MPQLVMGVPMFAQRLNNPMSNVEDTEAFLAKGIDPFELPGYICQPGYIFVKSGQLINPDDKIEYRLIFDQSTTVYIATLTEGSEISDIVGSAVETQVWRTMDFDHDVATAGLAKQCFKHFLGQFSIMITCDQMSGEGKNFWESLIKWALAEGHYVYAADGCPDDEDYDPRDGYLKHRINTVQELFEVYIPDWFGPDRDIHTGRRFIISNCSLG